MQEKHLEGNAGEENEHLLRLGRSQLAEAAALVHDGRGPAAPGPRAPFPTGRPKRRHPG
jgi:hypothetical protein